MVKNNNFIVIENGYKTIFEDKELAMKYYLDMCEWCEGSERNRYFEMYYSIKYTNGNTYSDNTKVRENRTYTYSDYKKDKEAEEQFINDMNF